MSDEQNVLDDPISSEFWSVPADFIGDESIRFLHADVVARLKEENPEADTLELMQIERIASLYFYMRFKESSGSMGSDQAYKGMMQLWISMAADLRKSRSGEADEADLRKDIAQGLARAVSKSLTGMEPEVAKMVRRRIAESLEAA